MNRSLNSNYQPFNAASSEILSGKTILITGASGFLGSRLAEVLTKEYGCTVYALIRNFSKAIKMSHLKINFIYGDLIDTTWASQLPPTLDFVFHCAYGNSGSSKERTKTDVNGTRNLVNVVSNRGIQKIVFTSTISIYKQRASGVINENSTIKPIDQYGKNKYNAEKEFIKQCKQYNLRYTILRPSAIIGAGAPFFVDAILDAIKTTRVVFLEKGEGLLNWVFLDDVILVMINSLHNRNSDNKRFIVNHPQPLTYWAYYNCLADIIEEKLMYEFLSKEENAKLQKKPLSDIWLILLNSLNRNEVRKLLAYKFINSGYALFRKIANRFSSQKQINTHFNSQPAPTVKPLTFILPTYVRFISSKVYYDSRQLIEAMLLDQFSDIDMAMESIRKHHTWEQEWKIQ